MTIYSFYVFDRHCTCVYFSSFSPKPPRPGPSTLPDVYRPCITNNSAPPQEDWNDPKRTTGGGNGALAFDEEAKLVYGIIFSLRNMVKKLSGREDDSFHSFSTSAYKVHYLHTPSNTHLVLVTSPTPDSLRPVLRQIWTGPYLDFVVRNPLVETDSNVSGKGIDNDAFRLAVEKIVATLQ